MASMSVSWGLLLSSSCNKVSQTDTEEMRRKGWTMLRVRAVKLETREGDGGGGRVRGYNSCDRRPAGADLGEQEPFTEER